MPNGTPSMMTAKSTIQARRQHQSRYPVHRILYRRIDRLLRLIDQRFALGRNITLQLRTLAVEVGKCVIHGTVQRFDERCDFGIQTFAHIIGDLRQVLHDRHDAVEITLQAVELPRQPVADTVLLHLQLENVLRPADAVDHLLGLASETIAQIGAHIGDGAYVILRFHAFRLEKFDPRQGRIDRVNCDPVTGFACM